MRKGMWLMMMLLMCAVAFAQQTNHANFTRFTDDAHWAIVSESLVNLYKEPSFKAEMISQALLGTPVKILAKDKNWHLLQTPEGYEGWVSAPLIDISRATLHQFNTRQRLIVTANNAFIYSAPHKTALIVSEVIMGNILFLETVKKRKGYYKVSFADGRKGFISPGAVKTWDEWKNTIQLTGASIEKTAEKFIGLPYFWGGTSSRGMDCSGFTKTTYLMHGIILPRDARQQYLTGVSIDSTNNFSKLQKGDLLFFGRKNPEDTTQYNIIHTGIYLHDRQFINADSKGITISSLDPSDNNFDAHNRRRYVIAKRILNVPENGTWRIFNHPWYQ